MKDAIAKLEQWLEAAPAELRTVSEAEAAARPGGKWSKKQILGHLVDSAANNHQRFVRAQIQQPLAFPAYQQVEWVAAQHYQDEPWAELIGLWSSYNRHLAHIVRAMPEAALAHTCAAGDGAPVTLSFLVDDYVLHLEHHLEQILGPLDSLRLAAELHELYRHEWWTNQRQLPDVRRMLAHTGQAIVIRDPADGSLAAFARIITDYAYKALVLDVITRQRDRGKGLGKELVERVLHHPALAGVSHFELYCRPELEPFYQRWGFTSELGELRFMRLERAPAADASRRQSGP